MQIRLASRILHMIYTSFDSNESHIAERSPI